MIHPGYTIRNERTGQIMTFLQTGKETNNELLEIECFSPPTTAREPEHLHPIQENNFKIISGELSFSVNGNIQILKAGEEISILPGMPHHFWNSGTETTHYLQEFRPALTTDHLFETFFALAKNRKLSKHGAPNIFRTSLIMLKHQQDLRIIKPSWEVQRIVFQILAPFAKLLGYKSYYEL